MTANESVELLFRARMEGQADVDRFAASVKNIQSGAIASTTSLQGLEAAIKQLTSATTANTTALEGMGSAGTRVTTALTGATGSTRTLTNEMRVLEGAMPIRAAAQFLTQIQGINAVASAAFPVLGAIALFGVVEQIGSSLGKHLGLWGGISEEEKKATENLNKYAEAARNSILQLRGIQAEIVTWTQGSAAGAAFKLQSDQGDLSVLQRTATNLDTRKAAIQRYLQIAQTGHGELSPEESAVMEGIWHDKSWTTTDVGAARKALNDLEAERRKTNAAIETQRGQVQSDIAHLNPSADEQTAQRLSEAREAQRQAQEAQRRAQEQANRLFELGKRSDETYSRAFFADESSPMRTRDAALQRIAEERADTLRKSPTGEAAAINADFDKQVAATWLTFLRQSGEALQKFNEEIDKSLGMIDKESAAGQVRQMAGIIAGGNDALSALGLPAGIAPPAGYVSPQEQMRLDRNSLTAALRGARGNPSETLALQSQGAEQEYQDQLRINAEKLKGNDLEIANLDALAAKKQKNFDAEMAYEDALDEQREKDLQKYQEMADNIFDALKSHSMNQYGRTFLRGQEQTLFANATAPILQGIGHQLGGLTGGNNLGGLLTGTVLDPSNAGSPATRTAVNTKGAWDELVKLNTNIKGALLGNPDAPTGATIQTAGTAAASVFSLPGVIGGSSAYTGMSGGLMQLIGMTGGSGVSSAAQLGLTGTAAALYNSYGGSGFSQFAAGMGAGPVAAITGTASGPGWSAKLNTTQRIGAGVAAGAELAAAGYEAYQGFSRGGAQGALQGTSAILGAASMIPGIGPFAAAASALTGMLSSIIGNGPQQRQQQIADYLAKDQYLAPTALNVMQAGNGTYESFDMRGNLMTSTMSAVPTVSEPYITKRTINGQQGWYDAPGYVSAPFSGGATGTGQTPVSNAPAGGTTVIVQGNLQAMDSQSFHEFITRPANVAATGEAVTAHLQSEGGERLAAQMRYHTNGQ